MRAPRVRLTVRRMMVAVAVVAVLCLGGREYWAWWLRRGYHSPVYQSRLSAQVAIRSHPWVLDPGSPIPVTITYDFRFAKRKPSTGTTCLLLAAVWFEDHETGQYVDGYTFDAPLTVGGREKATGSFTWEAMIPHAGRYMLRKHLSYAGPSGELKWVKLPAHPYPICPSFP